MVVIHAVAWMAHTLLKSPTTYPTQLQSVRAITHDRQVRHRLNTTMSITLQTYKKAVANLVLSSMNMDSHLQQDEAKWESHQMTSWAFDQDLQAWYADTQNAINRTEVLDLPPDLEPLNNTLIDAEKQQLNVITELEAMVEQSGDLSNRDDANTYHAIWDEEISFVANNVGIVRYPVAKLG